MSRKLALILIFVVFGLVVIFDFIMFLRFTGSLERITRSIQTFDNLYSQSFRMKQQLSLYSRKLRSHAVSLSNLDHELKSFLPSAKIKTSGDTLILLKPVQVDPDRLLNLLGAFTNISVVKISMKSLAPVKYVGFKYKFGFAEHVMLESLVVKVYGG